jgi:hypothetical protein
MTMEITAIATPEEFGEHDADKSSRVGHATIDLRARKAIE